MLSRKFVLLLIAASCLLVGCEREPQLSPQERLQQELIGAAGISSAEHVRTVLSKGADVNAVSESGLTPLIAALFSYEAISQHKEGRESPAEAEKRRGEMREIVRVLLEAKANPNVADKRGRTPLMYAREIRDEEVISMLIAAGATR